MARRGWIPLLPILVALLVSLPLAARDNEKNGKPTITELKLLNTVTLAGKELKPGMYTIKADDATVTLSMNGRVVAQAPVQWKDETKKPAYSQIITSDNQVKEIHFNGKMRYIAIGS